MTNLDHCVQVAAGCYWPLVLLVAWELINGRRRLETRLPSGVLDRIQPTHHTRNNIGGICGADALIKRYLAVLLPCKLHARREYRAYEYT